MLTNPYNPSGSHWSDNHFVQGRVSQEDFFWFKGKFPYGCKGIMDKIMATLFKKLIDELRRIDSETPIETAWCVDHDSYQILDDVIAKFQFVERRSTGEDSVGGAVVTQHVTGGTNDVHPEVQRPEVVSTDKEGRTKTRKRSRKGSKKKEV